jgi:hypothetical protein
MDKAAFRSFLAAKNTPEQDVDVYIGIVTRFEDHLLSSCGDITNQPIPPSAIEAFSDLLIASGDNTWNHYLALARFAQFRQDYDAFRFIIEMIDGCEVMENLYKVVAEFLGGDIQQDIFSDIDLPPMGSPNTRKPAVTRTVMERLESKAGTNTCRELLKDCLRDLPDKNYLGERQKYQACGSLDAYLQQCGDAFIEELEKLKEEGSLYYTQPVTSAVVEFVRANPEISHGVRRGNKLYKTKIPYLADEYLKETDEALKSYYYCHCPWVRESLKDGNIGICSTFCSCSAGFMKKPWEVIFGQPLEAEMLESVLDGDPWCRFAIQLPDGV